jgi:two-component system, NtrC family, response regulator HydG
MGRTARILVIDDGTSRLDPLTLSLRESGYAVEEASSDAEGLSRARRSDFDVVVTAIREQNFEVVARMKEVNAATEVIVVSSCDRHAAEAIEAGAFYVARRSVETARLHVLVERALEKRTFAAETLALRDALDGEKRAVRRVERATAASTRSALGTALGKPSVDIVGRSAPMREIYALIEAVAASDANVLIIGESGTGKELVANAIHAGSLRAGERFVKVDCATLPHELIEAELFGHGKGAFTGAASARRGLIAEADRGSLLLDEVGEMPMDLQPKLLRVLQEREYRPLGAGKPIPVDFRLIASTNREPLEAMRVGLLREDLFYRISTITIAVPPLRERSGDIDLLAESMLKRFAGKYGKTITGFSSNACEAMHDHAWPGNVRELENAIEHAVLLTRGATVEAAALPIVVPRRPRLLAAIVPIIARGDDYALATSSSAVSVPSGMTLAQIEREVIAQALRRAKGNKTAVASALGIYRPTLDGKIRKYRLTDYMPEERRLRAV